MLLLALGETTLQATHALAQVVVRRQALDAVHAQIETSVTSARNAVAAAIAAGADPASPAPVAPSPSATCRVAAQNGCAIVASSSIQFVPSATSPQASCPSDGCAAYEQGNDAVEEGRIDALIDAEATGSSGTALASRSARVTFRTMAIAPYAILAGSADASLAAGSGNPAGDDGGAVPQGSSPGTLVDVVYRNRASGAAMPANVWRAAGGSAGSAPAWSP